jgi:multicomponent Na+:H+ antiporter subunit D
MNMLLVVLPILIPLLFMILHLGIRRARIAGILGIAGSLLLLVSAVLIVLEVYRSGILSTVAGGWDAPFGISVVIDQMSALFLLVTSIIVVAISIFALNFPGKERYLPKFYFFFFSLILGVNGAFITGDIFNLYVWFEVMLLSSFVLITLGFSKEQLQGGIKYMAMNLIGSLFFLAGIGLLYGKTGTLNMAHLAQILMDDDQSLLINSSAMLFFLAFGIKAAVFPLFFWLPASYHTANITVTSLFAGILTKVGVYALIRFFTLFFVQDPLFWHTHLFLIAGLTMLIGGMAATSKYETREVLSYHIISQIGYMLMGLAIFTPLGVAGGIFFALHNMLAKTNTFVVAGLINRMRGTYSLKEVGGLFKESPVLAVLFIIPAFALAGIPPLSGFFAKFILIKAGFEGGHYLITGVALFVGLLTMYSMIKIWNEAFLKKMPEERRGAPTVKVRLTMIDVLPSVILGSVTILMGIFASTVFDLTLQAAESLLDPVVYIESVIKGS